MTPDTKDDSAEMGIWTTVGGYVLAAVIFSIMFAFATGFA